MKNILKIEGIKELNKSDQKNVLGGFLTEYVANCGPTTNGYDCFTGFAHCPVGKCSGGVCSPTTN